MNVNYPILADRPGTPDALGFAQCNSVKWFQSLNVVLSLNDVWCQTYYVFLVFFQAIV